MKVWLLGALALSTCLAACSNHVNITPETNGSGHGAAFPGGTGGSTSTGSTGAALAKVVTADTDIAQHASITTTSTAPDPVSTKVLDGPFFITDVIKLSYPLTTVQGTDCSVPEDKHTLVLSGSSSVTQVHGIRLPILAGQALCTQAGMGAGLDYNVTVLGFRPY
jgi:hypothetical protein